MKTKVQEQEGKLVALFEGRLDTAAASQTEADIQPLMSSDAGDVILDCTALDYISSSGLRLFISVLKSAHARNKEVYVRGMSDSIRDVFAMTGFINLFKNI